MTQSEILSEAKSFFGKDKRRIKKLVLSYEFKGENYRRWKKEIKQIIPNPNNVRFHLSEDVICWIKDDEAKQINWNWIGDLSWTIEVVLNQDVQKGYDWDRLLASKCKGTARILKIFISDVIPCYTYDAYYMTYSKKDNFYEFGPIVDFKDHEKQVLENVFSLLKNKGFQYLNQSFCEKKYKELYSDCNVKGGASLFDVLFSDVSFYTIERTRFCDKSIVEKSGNEWRWREYYDKNGVFKERIEYRYFNNSNVLTTVFNKGMSIKEVTVNTQIGKKHHEFKLNIDKEIKNKKIEKSTQKSSGDK
jgi:hypothetical protein